MTPAQRQIIVTILKALEGVKRLLQELIKE